MLSKENEMFEKFLKRLDPKDVQIKGVCCFYENYLHTATCTQLVIAVQTLLIVM